jgi:hypothetical protein
MSLKREIGIDAAEVEGFRWDMEAAYHVIRSLFLERAPSGGQFYPL